MFETKYRSLTESYRTLSGVDKPSVIRRTGFGGAGVAGTAEPGAAATLMLAAGALTGVAGADDCTGGAIGAVAVGFPPQARAMNNGLAIKVAIGSFMARRIKL